MYIPSLTSGTVHGSYPSTLLTYLILVYTHTHTYNPRRFFFRPVQQSAIWHQDLGPKNLETAKQKKKKIFFWKFKQDRDEEG